MCAHGDTVPVRVLVVARLCHSGRDEWKIKPIDRCIATLVEALQKAGIRTLGSCCGHGDHAGAIALDDGRTLRVTQSAAACEHGPEILSAHAGATASIQELS